MSQPPLSMIERAARYVSAMPAAISGSGGSVACLAVANVLKHGFALSREEAWPILIEYSERCSPPWSERELDHKWESAGRSHPMPRGYLRGSSAPTKPTKPIRTPRLDWRALAAQATARVAQAASPKQPTTPAAEFSRWRALIEAAARMFVAAVIPGEAEADDDDLRERLAAIGAILDQRDERGRIAYTRSQVEACRIGLARYAGTCKAADAMLARLAEAKRMALSWQTLAARWSEK